MLLAAAGAVLRRHPTLNTLKPHQRLRYFKSTRPPGLIFPCVRNDTMNNNRDTLKGYTTATNDLSESFDELDTDFRKKYPPDPVLGQEAADSARVWKVYRGEATEYDDATLHSWNDTVNILLTFAGLFSAAVTSFVLQSFQQLQPKPNAELISALYILLAATHNATTGPAAADPPSSRDRWVNALWFISLFFSLAAALMCILVKQWLDEYTARTRASSKNAREWALRHAFYFRGIRDWHIPVIISILPIILHLALFLFLSGLVVFIWDVDPTIRRGLLGLLCPLAGYYLFTVFVPFWSAACPFSTPLVDQLRSIPYIVRIFSLRVNIFIRGLPWIVRDRIVAYRLGPLPLAGPPTLPRARYALVAWTLRKRIEELDAQRSRQGFDRALASGGDELESLLTRSVLEWLLFEVSDSDAVAVALQSLPAVHRRSGDSVAHLRDTTSVKTLSLWRAATATAGQSNMPDTVRAAQSFHFIRNRYYVAAVDHQGSTTARSDFVRHIIGRSYPNITAGIRTFVRYSSSIQLAYAYLLRNSLLNSTDVLHMLCCVDLGNLPASTWNKATLTLAIPDKDQDPICAYAAATWHGSACGSTCLLAYLVSAERYRDDKAIADIRRRLIAEATFSSLPLNPASPLFGFFLSPMFIPGEHSDFPVRAIAGISLDNPQWTTMLFEAPEDMLLAAMKCLRCNDHLYDVYGFINILRPLLDVSNNSVSVAQAIPQVQRAGAVADRLLALSPTPPLPYPLLLAHPQSPPNTSVPDPPPINTLSVWQELHAKAAERPLERIIVLDVLTTALCAQELSPAIDGLLKEMLSIVDFDQYIAHAFGLQCYGVDVLPFLVRIWQHCVAIAPTIWSTYFLATRPDVDDTRHLLPRHHDYIEKERPMLRYTNPSDLYQALRDAVALGPCHEQYCGCKKPAVWPPTSPGTQAPLVTASHEQSNTPTTT